MGSPGTWEVLLSPLKSRAGGNRRPTPELLVSFRCACKGANKQADNGILERRKLSSRRGAQEVGTFHSTEEAGELSPEDPVEGRGRHVMNPFGRKDVRNVESWERLNETPEDSGFGQGSSGYGDNIAFSPYRYSNAI